MIRVVVVDDEALVRSGFSLVLGAVADIEVVATATGAEPAVVDAEAADVELLTARERDVLVLLAEGLSNAEIGTRLYAP